jgi:subtilase family protein
MTERPILPLLNPRNTSRKTGSPRNMPRPSGPNRQRQGQRFQATFDRLSNALAGDNASIALRQDPSGIAPERALVFITAGEIQGFAKAAEDVGLELITELDLETTEDFPDGFEPAGGGASLSPELYATMPTVESFDRLLALWRGYLQNSPAPRGSAPWWNLFSLLIELRPWGPEDRFPESARAAITERLPFNDDDEAIIELEIWPSANKDKRVGWRQETEDKILALGGRIIDRSSIAGDGFIYEAILVGLDTGILKEIIANPFALNGLATLEGIQFILPQTIAQTPLAEVGEDESTIPIGASFGEDMPIRAALFDGTPVAAHPALEGGVEIEDVHDLVRQSQVDQRYHATSMASLILRGDLKDDGSPVTDTRLVSVPLLVDSNGGASSPPEKLFVDVLHTALIHVFAGDEPLAPQVFVINFSIGVQDIRFAGRLSALARLIDWWASHYGVLFVISAGNIPEDLLLDNVSAIDFESASISERQEIVRTALRNYAYERTLLSPAEALNGITVGALSEDLTAGTLPVSAEIMRLEDEGELLPAIVSARGLGPFRSIKPDFLTTGGIHEVRVLPALDDARLSVLGASQRTGLHVASPNLGGGSSMRRSRGTSCAAALTTRAILRAAEALVEDGGPYQGQELPRQDFALLTRALAVNSARWSEDIKSLYEIERERFGRNRHASAKQEVAKHVGHGILSPMLMQESPGTGVTLVGLGTIRKDQAKVFDLPLPESLSGDKVARSMRVTLTWFSPVDASRVRYRLASLEAIAADIDEDEDAEKDNEWGLKLKSDGPDSNMVKRGTVWSRRLVHSRLTVPEYEEGTSLPIRVQCSDASGGGLNPDLDIRFAVVVTLEIETPVQYDIHDEVRTEIAVRLKRGD